VNAPENQYIGGAPGRTLPQAVTVNFSATSPFVGPKLAVEYYFFVCSRR